MLEELTLKQKKKSEDLSNQFDNWLYKDRGRQIKGIKYFLNKRSDNTDDLIVNLALTNNLNVIQDFGIFSVGGYGRGELHPLFRY
jgi:UTP:GlnB (protein PII) uridylyltransferase